MESGLTMDASCASADDWVDVGEGSLSIDSQTSWVTLQVNAAENGGTDQAWTDVMQADNLEDLQLSASLVDLQITDTAHHNGHTHDEAEKQWQQPEHHLAGQEPAPLDSQAVSACLSTQNDEAEQLAQTVPAQADDKQVTVRILLEHEQIIANADGTVSSLSAVVSVIAPSVIAKRAPVSLIAVIDRSGSMKGSKLVTTLKTLRFVLTQLHDIDSFGLVSFGEDVRIDIPLTNCTPESKIRMEAAFQAIQAGGSTNLSGGLLRAIEMHRESRGCLGVDNQSGADQLRSVFLLTDGHANRGITGPHEITSAVQSSLEEMHPCKAATIHCFGFGSDHNASMLRAVAETGSGNYFYIKNDEMIAAEFAGALGGLLSTVMQSTILRFKSPFMTLQTGLPCNVAADGTHAVELGDLFAEERRDILVEFKPSATEGRTFIVGEIACLCDVSVRGFCLATNSWHQQAKAITAAIVATDLERSAPDMGVAKQRNRFIATQAMEAALKYADHGHLRAARNECTAALRQIKSTQLFEINDPLTLKLVSDLRECRQSMLDPQAYEDVGSKTLTSCTMSHTRQAHGDYYMTSEQMTMRTMTSTYMGRA